MLKLIDNNPLLYSTEKTNYEKSLQYAKKLKSIEDNNLVFHCFWRVPKEFGLKQVSVIKSIIVNHKHKLDKVEINLWSNVDLSTNEYIKEVLPFIKLKVWSLESEMKGTILEGNSYIRNEVISDTNCYLEGDIFRLLILHKYGGFYIDMDVLVLRDMSPISNLEFLYQWGPTGFKCFHTNTIDKNLRMNGAIMRLDKNSDLSLEFLNLLELIPPHGNSTCWGSGLYSKATKNDILVLPCIWFNSEWGYEGTNHTQPFKKYENIMLFDGAFTWHWHNRWDEEIEEGSKFNILTKKHNEEFKDLIK